MSDEKKKILRTYYKVLSFTLSLYLIIGMIINRLGVIAIGDHILLFTIGGLIYYLIVKNILSNVYQNKIFELDPDLKKRVNEKNTMKKEQLKQMAPKVEGKWYKNTVVLYVIGIITLLILYRLFG